MEEGILTKNVLYVCVCVCGQMATDNIRLEVHWYDGDSEQKLSLWLRYTTLNWNAYVWTKFFKTGALISKETRKVFYTHQELCDFYTPQKMKQKGDDMDVYIIEDANVVHAYDGENIDLTAEERQKLITIIKHLGGTLRLRL